MNNMTRISDQQFEILKLTYQYRCMTYEYLAKIMFKHLSSSMETKKSNISRQVATLNKFEMLETVRCLKNSNELFLFLTDKGVEYVKEHIEIDRNNKNAGFVDIFGDFSADLLRNIQHSIDHYKIYLNLATTSINYNFRHNLYCSKKFGLNDRIRPDGELQSIGNPKKIIALECDTGSESYQQLLEKFINYKKYFDYCTENNLEIRWKAILFECNKKHSSFENDMRWHNIIRAAVQGLESYCFEIQVLLNTKYQRQNNLHYLIKQEPKLLERIGIKIPLENKGKKDNTEKYDKQYKRLILESERNRKDIINLELENEALRKWCELPDQHRLKKVGMFKKAQDLARREIFIKEYVEKNFEKRKNTRFPLLNFED